MFRGDMSCCHSAAARLLLKTTLTFKRRPQMARPGDGDAQAQTQLLDRILGHGDVWVTVMEPRKLSRLRCRAASASIGHHRRPRVPAVGPHQRGRLPRHAPFPRPARCGRTGTNWKTRWKPWGRRGGSGIMATHRQWPAQSVHGIAASTACVSRPTAAPAGGPPAPRVATPPAAPAMTPMPCHRAALPRGGGGRRRRGRRSPLPACARRRGPDGIAALCVARFEKQRQQANRLTARATQAHVAPSATSA